MTTCTLSWGYLDLNATAYLCCCFAMLLMEVRLGTLRWDKWENCRYIGLSVYGIFRVRGELRYLKIHSGVCNAETVKALSKQATVSSTTEGVWEKFLFYILDAIIISFAYCLAVSNVSHVFIYGGNCEGIMREMYKLIIVQWTGLRCVW